MSERTISRRDLYAIGETIGSGATRRKLGGGYVCGFGGDSTSRQESTTNNYDKRVAVQGGTGVSGDGNSVTINTTDGGITARALQTVDLSNASLGEGYQALIDGARDLFSSGESLIGQTQKSVADAYSLAKTDQAGGIDQKTIIVLAVAGAVAVYAMNRK